jgi:hypothetical protein
MFTFRNIKGFNKTATYCRAEHWGREMPYTVQFAAAAGSRERFAVVNISPCPCQNKATWADRGAPPPCLKYC